MSEQELTTTFQLVVGMRITQKDAFYTLFKEEIKINFNCLTLNFLTYA